MTLHLPPAVLNRMLNEQRAAQVDADLSAAREFTRHLKELDHRLDLVWVKEGADHAGLHPGRWHVRRSNEGAPDTYMVICGPEGEYLEPHSGVLDELRRRDLQTDEGIERALKEDRAREEAVERERERQAVDRRAEIIERVNVAMNASVTVPHSLDKPGPAAVTR